LVFPIGILAWGFDTKERFKEYKAKKDKAKKSLKNDLLSEIKAAGLNLAESTDDEGGPGHGHGADSDDESKDTPPVRRRPAAQNSCPQCKRPY